MAIHNYTMIYNFWDFSNAAVQAEKCLTGGMYCGAGESADYGFDLDKREEFRPHASAVFFLYQLDENKQRLKVDKFLDPSGYRGYSGEVLNNCEFLRLEQKLEIVGYRRLSPNQESEAYNLISDKGVQMRSFVRLPDIPVQWPTEWPIQTPSTPAVWPFHLNDAFTDGRTAVPYTPQGKEQLERDMWDFSNTAWLQTIPPNY